MCSPCSATCFWCGAAGHESADYCTKCETTVSADPDLFLDSTAHTCVESCPAGTFEDGTTPANPVCTACIAPCIECSTDGDTCTKCEAYADADPKRYLEPTTDTCATTCVDTYWPNHTDDASAPVCSPCNAPCLHCDTSGDHCTRCASSVGLAEGVAIKYLDSVAGACVEECPVRFFEDLNDPTNPICSPCIAPCWHCSTDGDTCIKCEPSGAAEPVMHLNTVDDTCVEACPETYYENIVLDADNPRCLPCDANCFWCGTTATECTKCLPTDTADLDPVLYLDAVGHACVEDCPGTFWEDATTTNPVCSACEAPCKWCKTSATTCSKCFPVADEEPDLFLDTTTDDCIASCPDTYWEDKTDVNNPLCSPCDENCLHCNLDATDCTLCDKLKFPKVYLNLEFHVCLTDCLLKLWENPNADGLMPVDAPNAGPICSPCDDECWNCFGPTSDECTRCIKNDTHVWYLNAPDLNPTTCYKPCRFGQWDDDVTNSSDPKCALCDPACNGCNNAANAEPTTKGGANTNCDACSVGYYNNTDGDV